MNDKVECVTHGESYQTFVCTHLLGEGVGLGFNCAYPSEGNLFPDAWCDDCELIRAAHGGWNEQSEKLVKISLLCSGCYERARIRNTHPSVTFNDLANLRWKCGTCEEWHYGPCLDFGYHAPEYWLKIHDETDRKNRLRPGWIESPDTTFLDEDFCAIEARNFFVRGIIHLPIIGAAETFRWGVWGSVSRENFEKLLQQNDDSKRVELPEMFSWLSNGIADYPDTLNLKMYACIQDVGTRPHFRLERTDHPLAVEYHQGITPERVKQLMLARVSAQEL